MSVEQHLTPDQVAVEALAARVEVLQNQISADRTEMARLQAALQSARDQIDADRTEMAKLEDALLSARRIGAAIGIIMATLKVTENEAFNVLVHASQYSNRKVRDLAEDVIVTGIVPAVWVGRAENGDTPT